MVDEKPAPWGVRVPVDRVHLSIRLSVEVVEQIRALAATFSTSHTAVISQAVARWYYSEPVLKGKRKPRKRKTNGSSST